MQIPGLPVEYHHLHGEVPATQVRVLAEHWVAAARAAREAHGRIVALWGADNRDRGQGFSAWAAYAMKEGLVVLELPIAERVAAYPGVAGYFPGAGRMERAIFDLLGIAAEGATDRRPWLRHGAWGATEFPLRRDFDATAARDNAPENYAFVRVEGEGVHEIPVGPIHAGIIEPGHFRFSIVGEKVLRLEERLGYTHKGADKRFEDFSVADGYRLAGRISGDSTVAYAWAYAQAAESALGFAPPPRARWLRGLMLERERVANHLGDLGALGNDGGLAFAFAHFMRLKEDWLRVSAEVFGHRFMMDRIVPGGVETDVNDAQRIVIAQQVKAIGAEVRVLHDIFDEHSGLQDRFLTAGRVTHDLARQLGLAGLAGRASGQAFDLRADHPCAPYSDLAVKKVVHSGGDVAYRVRVRFEEIEESLRLILAILDQLPAGPLKAAAHEPKPDGFGVGWVEGWRGEVLVALETGDGGRIRRCHAHDPSWQAWPLLEHAVIGNIVPDFPLINKSFNLSYSGQDS
jgi:Ni,Fe-hydrogenase III large subunit/Ni,Fe-hydrogenase III component G